MGAAVGAAVVQSAHTVGSAEVGGVEAEVGGAAEAEVGSAVVGAEVEVRATGRTVIARWQKVIVIGSAQEWSKALKYPLVA